MFSEQTRDDAAPAGRTAKRRAQTPKALRDPDRLQSRKQNLCKGRTLKRSPDVVLDLRNRLVGHVTSDLTHSPAHPAGRCPQPIR